MTAPSLFACPGHQQLCCLQHSTCHMPHIVRLGPAAPPTTLISNYYSHCIYDIAPMSTNHVRRRLQAQTFPDRMRQQEQEEEQEPDSEQPQSPLQPQQPSAQPRRARGSAERERSDIKRQRREASPGGCGDSRAAHQPAAAVPAPGAAAGPSRAAAAAGQGPGGKEVAAGAPPSPAGARAGPAAAPAGAVNVAAVEQQVRAPV